ncbi:MAG: hypothetical protein ACI9XB_000387 [Gammaproteobacteria bacterium]|jgi:hypothetical protein
MTLNMMFRGLVHWKLRFVRIRIGYFGINRGRDDTNSLSYLRSF